LSQWTLSQWTFSGSAAGPPAAPAVIDRQFELAL
jgi:hypothetical protein